MEPIQLSIKLDVSRITKYTPLNKSNCMICQVNKSKMLLIKSEFQPLSGTLTLLGIDKLFTIKVRNHCGTCSVKQHYHVVCRWRRSSSKNNPSQKQRTILLIKLHLGCFYTSCFRSCEASLIRNSPQGHKSKIIL